MSYAVATTNIGSGSSDSGVGVVTNVTTTSTASTTTTTAAAAVGMNHITSSTGIYNNSLHHSHHLNNYSMNATVIMNSIDHHHHHHYRTSSIIPHQPPLYHVLLLDEKEVDDTIVDTIDNGTTTTVSSNPIHHKRPHDDDVLIVDGSTSKSSTTGSSTSSSSGGGHEMITTTTTKKKRRRSLLVLDKSLQNDYLAKRYRAYCDLHQLWLMEQQQQQQRLKTDDTNDDTNTQNKKKKIPIPPTNRNSIKNIPEEEWMSDIYKPKIKQVNHDNNNNNNNDNDNSINFIRDENESYWHGATPLERALMTCCVPPPPTCPNQYHNNHNGGTMDVSSSSSSSSFTTRQHCRTYCSDTNDNHSSSNGASSSSSSSSHAPGVLVREHIPNFVGHMAMYCHTVASRALVLAILQVTVEMDLFDEEDEHERLQQYNIENDFPDDNNNDNEIIKEEYSSTQTDQTEAMPGTIKTSNDVAETLDTLPDISSETNIDKSNSIGKIVVERMSPKFVRPRRELLPTRISMFMQVGGLQLLARWFKESITVQKVNNINVPMTNGGKKNNSTKVGTSPPKNKAKQKQPPIPQIITSPTGKLVLPIIQFLQQIPFDSKTRKLIRQSNIHNDLLALQKKLKSIVASQMDTTNELSIVVVDGEIRRSSGTELSFLDDDPSVQMKTDPRSGGLPVMVVLKEVNQLIDIWKVKHEKIKNDRSKKELENKYKEVPDPFAQILSEINDRLHVLQAYEGIDPRTITDTGATKVTEPPITAKVPDSELPDWMKDVIDKRNKKLKKLSNDPKHVTAATTANNRILTVRERERLEHAKERKKMHEKNKAELEKNQKEKAEILKRIREKDAARARTQSTTSHISSGDGSTFGIEKSTIVTKSLQRKVKWKDGLTSISSNVRKEFLEQVFVFTPDDNEWPVGKKGKYNESNISNNNNEAYDDEENDHNNTEDHDEEENCTTNEAQYEDDEDHSTRENQYNDSISSSTASNGYDNEEQQDDTKWENCNDDEVDDDDDDDDNADDDDEVVVLENHPQHSTVATTETFGRLPPEQWKAMTWEQRQAHLQKIRPFKLTNNDSNRQAPTAGLFRTKKRWS